MSGLEKFEATSAWRSTFKKLLFMERSTVLQASRQKDTPKIADMFNNENKENEAMNKMPCTQSQNAKTFVSAQILSDDTVLDIKRKQDVSDESFEVMEKICDKTGSDPNSTLFQYLHSDNKCELVNQRKERDSHNAPAQQECEPQSFALQHLLNKMEERDPFEIPSNSVEETQIEDIEAPSRLWENTIAYDGLQTSPVKMVGLLRPSTIIEECAEDASTGNVSFETAQVIQSSEASSSCYETASDSIFFPNKRKSIERELERDPLETIDTLGCSGLINLVDTSMALEADVEKNTLVDESIIEVCSDDDDKTEPSSNIATESPLIKFEEITMYSHLSNANLNSDLADKLENVSTNNDVASKFNSECFFSNAGVSYNNVTQSPIKDASLHFNDTLEEVEYMMKKGLEFMTAEATNTHQVDEVLPPQVLKEKQNTFLISPAKSYENIKLKTPNKDLRVTPLKASPKVASGAVAKSASKLPNRFELNMKPIPKLDIFKKPVSAFKKKDNFAHVVSPIGTYMKKTITTPLMTTIKTQTDDFNSTAFRQLEYESRLYQPKLGTTDLNLKQLPISPNARSLPKKAYISSEYKQVLDERTPVTIPGGKKIQKYLDAAVLPAVLRHDGKMKISNSGANSKLPIRIQKNSDVTDTSLANLSVATGDVSVYTIKDAQKL